MAYLWYNKFKTDVDGHKGKSYFLGQSGAKKLSNKQDTNQLLHEG